MQKTIENKLQKTTSKKGSTYTEDYQSKNHAKLAKIELIKHIQAIDLDSIENRLKLKQINNIVFGEK